MNFGIINAIVAMATKNAPKVPQKVFLLAATHAVAANAPDRVNIETI
jgi:hypothetical protein